MSLSTSLFRNSAKILFSFLSVFVLSCGDEQGQQNGRSGKNAGTEPSTADAKVDEKGAVNDSPNDPVKKDTAEVKPIGGENDDGQLPVVEDPVTAPVDTKKYSLGSGGALGMTEVNFTDTDNLASSYKINVPADASLEKAYGLHIHLHGDGGGGYQDFPNKETREGLIGVTVRAPNRNLQWGRSQGVAHANYVRDLIQNELVKRYNIDLERIYFSGVSGGAFFLSGHFIPMYGKFYESGAFLMCGGMTPQVGFDEPAFLQKFRLHWQITAGERRDITRSVTAAIAAYQRAVSDTGVTPAPIQSSETLGNGGHCEFDGISYTSGIQYMMDLKFKTILKENQIVGAP